MYTGEPGLHSAMVNAVPSDLGAVRRARVMLARELWDADYQTRRAIRAWATWIGWPVLLPEDREGVKS